MVDSKNRYFAFSTDGKIQLSIKIIKSEFKLEKSCLIKRMITVVDPVESILINKPYAYYGMSRKYLGLSVEDICYLRKFDKEDLCYWPRHVWVCIDMYKSIINNLSKFVINDLTRM